MAVQIINEYRVNEQKHFTIFRLAFFRWDIDIEIDRSVWGKKK